MQMSWVAVLVAANVWTFGAVAQDAAKIGILTDMTGPLSDAAGPGSVVAAQMAIEDFGGTVLGKKIELVSADHQNKPDTGAAIARRWFETEGVTVIGDNINSGVALAVQFLARDRKKIALFSGAGVTQLINENCSPTGFNWNFDAYASTRALVEAVVEEGGDSWFMIAADYSYGQKTTEEAQKFIAAKGGKFLGVVKHPAGTSDFSSYILSAQSSGAKVIGIASGGNDLGNTIKQAHEFGVARAGQKVVGFSLALTDVHGAGLEAAQGAFSVTTFYHARNAASEAWAQRYSERMHRPPGYVHASVYSSVLHYLRAVRTAGTTDGLSVAAKMRETPVDDFFAPGATIRADGRLMNDLYLFQVKTPAESKAPWDYFKILRTLPAKDILQPLSESKCDLVK
jgi:branched-chain amino acid transport system substrate-binding protein